VMEWVAGWDPGVCVERYLFARGTRERPASVCVSCDGRWVVCGRRVRERSDVAVGGRFAGLKDFTVEDTEYPDAEISGGAFSFGGGIYFYFSQTFSMDIGVKFSGGEFTDVKVGNLTAGGFDIDASSTRFKVGVVWWP